MGECSFWYRPVQVVWDKGPLNSCVCAVVVVSLDFLLLVKFASSFCVPWEYESHSFDKKTPAYLWHGVVVSLNRRMNEVNPHRTQLVP